MKARTVSLGLILLLICGAGRASSVSALSPATPPSASLSPERHDVLFIENVGQFDEEARFLVYGGDRHIWLTERAIWVTVLEPSPLNLRLSFVDANPRTRLQPFDRLETSVSYFIGNDPARWHSQVPVWGGVRYEELYRGIDLEISSSGGSLTWQLLARPGADLSAVRLRVEGAEGMALDGNALRLATAAGSYELPLFPVIGAGPGGTSRPAIVGDQVLAPFARRTDSHLQATLTSTSTLLYSTFLGSTDYDMARSITVDESGAMYVIGDTDSPDFPTTPGAFDRGHNGSGDLFVVKLDPTGSTLIYATFIGGSKVEYSLDYSAVDASGALYIASATMSPDFPTTPGAFDRVYDGGHPFYMSDVVVVKLNATGSALLFSTYLGGAADDMSGGLAIDASGAVYVAGQTWGCGFPTTPGAFDRTHGSDPPCEDSDCFVTKFNPSGSALLYSTYLGGWDDDSCENIAVDSAGAAYVTGWARGGFPTTPGAFDTTFDYSPLCLSPCYDAFVAKLNPAGSALVYSTYLGGGTYDNGTGIAVDATGAAYVSGSTSSDDFPVTPGAYDETYNDPYSYWWYSDVFVTKLNPSGSDLVYSTYLGGGGWDYGRDLAINAAGEAYLLAVTMSNHFPTTPGAFCRYRHSSDDIALAKLNATGSKLLYSTYLGTMGDDYPWSVAVDAYGDAYLAGWTESSVFPTTFGAYDTTFNGVTDAIVAKFRPSGPTSDNVDAYVHLPRQVYVSPDGAIALPVGYGNLGATKAVSAVLTATLPVTLTYLGDTSGITPTVQGNVVSWALPALPFPTDEEFTLLLGRTAPDPLGTRYTLHFEIASGGIEDDPRDNTADVDVIVARKVFLPLVGRRW